MEGSKHRTENRKDPTPFFCYKEGKVETKKKVDEAWKARIKEEAAASGKTKEIPKEGKKPQPEEPLLEPNFSAFISGLGMQALLFLGEISDPEGKGKIKSDYQQARHIIDLIDILKNKTEGNLDKEEASFIENILYDLRMRYLKASKSK